VKRRVFLFPWCPRYLGLSIGRISAIFGAFFEAQKLTV